MSGHGSLEMPACLADDVELLAVAADAADAALLKGFAGNGIAKVVLFHVDRVLAARVLAERLAALRDPVVGG